MSTVTWAGTTGNWSDATKWDTAGTPTSADDVVFGTAGTVMATIDVNVVCRSLTVTNFGGTLVHNAACTVTIGDGTAGAGSVALAF